MGSKWTEWNIENDDDFYSATKIALHSYKEGVAPKDKYILGNRSVDGNTVETIQRRGRKVLDIAQTLYEYGINGKEVYESPSVNVNTNGENKIENINGVEYYTQNYKVTANKTLNSYKVSIENFVSGTKILDSSNKEKSSFTNNTFKIAIPTKNIKENINGKINIIDAQVKTCPVYYAQSSVPSAQSYVTYTSSYELASNHTNLNISSNNANLKITKIDSKTKKPLPNVTFKLTDEKGANLGEYTTNQNGVIEIKNMKPGTVTIKEIKVDDKYVLNPTENKLTLEWGKTSTITIENDKKQGKINVRKTDLENNKIRLEGVEFELYNDKNELIKKLVTDKNGEIKVDNLDIGNYTLKEVKTNEKYILNDEKIELKVEWNKETVLEVKNARKKGNLKVIKQDIEDEQIKLEGVEFELYDNERKLINKYTTDVNGEIVVENLNIGNYYLKETKTNEKYVLNEKEIEIKIEWNKETKIEVKNLRKKGSLKIIKVDSENAEIKLEGVEFELYDNEENYINKYTTNENGEIIVENLDIGDYKLKEIKTNEKYILNEEKIETKVEHNKETALEVKNDKIKGQIQITKISEDDNKITGQKKGSPIANVEFEIKDEQGNLVETIKTNEEGIAITSKLEKGKYSIKETKADENYELNSKEYILEIKENNEIIDIQIANKSKNKLPRTGF